MTQYPFYIFILLLSFIFTGCETPNENLEIAYEVRENNLKGKELFESLNEEEKNFLGKHINGLPYDGTPLLREFNGNIKDPLNRSKVQRLITYRPPEEELSPKKWTPKIYEQFKHNCTKRIIEFDSTGILIKDNSKTNYFKNGKLTRYHHKKYSYSDDETRISWVDNHENEIIEKYTLKDYSVNMNVYKNGKLTKEYKREIHNENMQRTYGYYMEIIFGDTERADVIKIDYDEYSRVKNIYTEYILNMDNDTTITTSERNFLYNSVGLLNSMVGAKNIFGIYSFRIDYFHNFFLDEEDHLNVYKVTCPKRFSHTYHVLDHYIFDEHLNLIYSQNTNFKTNRSYSYYKEYKYFE